MLSKFYLSNSLNNDLYQKVVESVRDSFYLLNNNYRAFGNKNVTGPKEHLICQIKGSLTTKETENGPSFEVFIDSACEKIDEIYNKPFKTFIVSNHKDKQIREVELRKAENNCNISESYNLYYNSAAAKTIDSFNQIYLQEHGKEPGPNSKRLLEGLKYLESVKMRTQTVGNCWIKQNERQILGLAFIEILTRFPELTIEKSWEEAVEIYRKWTEFTNKEIKILVENTDVPPFLKKTAIDKLKAKTKA